GRLLIYNDRRKEFPGRLNNSEPIHGTRTLLKNRRFAGPWSGAFRRCPSFAYRRQISGRRSASRGYNRRPPRAPGDAPGARVGAYESDYDSFDPITRYRGGEKAGGRLAPKSTKDCEPFPEAVPTPPASAVLH